MTTAAGFPLNIQSCILDTVTQGGRQELFFTITNLEEFLFL